MAEHESESRDRLDTARETYERPTVTIIELKPEEQLLVCGKQPGFCIVPLGAS